ncbi:outer membrane beta-barrel protein [Methylomonas sp.]|uniref:outer membrane protein n=1 Tax=Methylomonas sp. TaxID=418 RepID=UPI0025F7BB5B|nr:outer membrane beta-barrel protein [Methylomonas sp.]
MAKGNNSATDIDRDDRELGYRFGVGADSPLTESLFLRMEYNYTDYSPYRFTTTQASSDTVEFDNSDSMFRLGVGAHF